MSQQAQAYGPADPSAFVPPAGLLAARIGADESMSDEELMAAYGAGDERAFRLLFDRVFSLGRTIFAFLFVSCRASNS